MKKLFFYLLAVTVFMACNSASLKNKKENRAENKYIIGNLIKTATDNIGIRYKAGGNTKNGFDCSGLVFFTFQSEDILLPRSSFEQSKIGQVILFDEAKRGDLIFFKTNKSRQINHVGLITEANSSEIKFVHSSTSKGVIISSTKEKYYHDSFTQINRVLE
nr:C40 family peptidase [uncultured Flavobacterium sp.]